jgi:hypothetical protein
MQINVQVVKAQVYTYIELSVLIPVLINILVIYKATSALDVTLIV